MWQQIYPTLDEQHMFYDSYLHYIQDQTFERARNDRCLVLKSYSADIFHAFLLRSL